ncbi:unnamed protein product, partial [Adineta ricciae]
SYFIGGFKYDGKAVFGVIETSERSDTNRVSRLVMACANRAEIVRKAILNCSTDMFDRSHSFVFHILTALVDPIHTSNDSTLLFATFTTNNSSITASAVCLFVLDKQFYDVFTAPSKSMTRRTSIINNELNDLIRTCSPSIPSTIDRDMVESDRQFSSYLSNPLLIESMSTSTFSALNVIQYDNDHYCLIIGTSNGHLFTAFMDRTYKTNVYEELILPKTMRYAIKSITYEKVDEYSYAVIVTNHREYLVLKLVQCNEKFCLDCWTTDCFIRKISPVNTTVAERCPMNQNLRSIVNNDTGGEDDSNNHSLSYDWSVTNKSSDDQSNNKLLLYIVVPMSFIVFVLSVLIIILLTKSNRKQRRRRKFPHNHHEKTKQLTSTSINDSYTYSNNVLYRTNNDDLPNKSELSIPPISYTVYSTSSAHSLPPLVSSVSSTPPLIPHPKTPQSLSVHRLYKSYV